MYDTLQREILTLELAPGTALDETQLAQRFSSSRSPVREALSRLAAQNLVVMLPNRSTVVAPLTLSDFPRYIEALDLSQRVCTRLAAERRTEEQLSAMSAAADAFDRTLVPHDHLEMLTANKRFHMAVAAAAHNRFLAAQYDALLDEGRRFMRLYFLHLEGARYPNPLAEDHHVMVEAIAARDADEAERLARVHTAGFRDRLLSFLGRNGTAAIDVAVGRDTTPDSASGGVRNDGRAGRGTDPAQQED